MKRCPECSAEIPDALSLCAGCDPGTTALVPLRAPNTSIVAVASAMPAAPQPGGHRRELWLAAGGAMAAAVVTFALLSLRGGSSPALAAVSAAAVSAAAAPAFAAPAAPAPHVPEKPAATPRQRWNGENRQAWLGNGRGAAFELRAESAVQTWFGPVQPVLVVRCTSRTVETFVYTRTPVKIEPDVEGRTVTVSIDDEPMRTENWSSSDDHVALFAPDGAGLAERLTRAHSLRFGYAPHNSNGVVAQFSVAGLGELLEPAARECGLKK